MKKLAILILVVLMLMVSVAPIAAKGGGQPSLRPPGWAQNPGKDPIDGPPGWSKVCPGIGGSGIPGPGNLSK